MGLLSMSTSGQPEERKPFGERVKESARSGELWDNLAVAFNSLRMNPDPNINAMAERRMERRDKKETQNKTMQWLQAQAAQYPQLAPLLGAVATGGIDMGSAVNAAYGAIQEANAPKDPWAGVKVIGDTAYTMGPNGPQKVIGPQSADTNTTAAWLRQNGRPDLADAVVQGITPAAEAVKEAMKRDKPLVEVNTGENTGTFTKESDKLAATRFDGYINEGKSASRMVADIKTLSDLAAQFETGAGGDAIAAFGPYAEAVGIDIKGLDAAQAYKAIVDRMAPAMRPAGSGASSDFDARQFLSSLPSLSRTPGGNALIMQTLKAVEDHKIATAEIASRAMLAPDDPNFLTWQEAEGEIRRLGDPYELFRKQRGNVGGEGGGQVSAAPADAPQLQWRIVE